MYYAVKGQLRNKLHSFHACPHQADELMRLSKNIGSGWKNVGNGLKFNWAQVIPHRLLLNPKLKFSH